jgi:hypothetical protein
MKNYDDSSTNSGWCDFYKFGAVAVILTIIVGVIELSINFLPGGNILPKTVGGWFELYQNNWFLGLRDMGLLNYFLSFFGIVVIFTLYGVLKKENEPIAKLALIFYVLGSAIFYSTNRAFPMLDLSRQFSLALTEEQRTIITAAGQVMISIGEPHSLGNFIGNIFNELSFLLMSILMIRSKVFNKIIGVLGVISFALMMVVEIIMSFLPNMADISMILASIGGLSVMVIYFYLVRKLFQLGQV